MNYLKSASYVTANIISSHYPALHMDECRYSDYNLIMPHHAVAYTEMENETYRAIFSFFVFL